MQTIRKRDLLGFYARDHARKKWGYFGTLGFRRRSIPYWMAERCFSAWASEFTEELDDFWWVRLNVKGAFPDKPLFHVLLRLDPPESKYSLMAAWQQIAGDAELEYFSHGGNVLRFYADIARTGDKFEIAEELLYP